MPREKISGADLEILYQKADEVDKKLFAEMRSNLLLVDGEHYNKTNSAFLRRIRSANEINEQQKLRLTKNHVQRISKTYVNNIIGMSPNVGFKPKNDKELHDQKSAELHHAVWRDAFERFSLDEMVEDWADDFVNIGEVAVKIFWDPQAGKTIGYGQKVDEKGEPILDESGQMIPDPEDPTQEGEGVFEPIYGFNLLRAPEAKSFKSSEYLIVRKMVPIKELRLRYGKNPDADKALVASEDRTFKVFDASRGGYVDTKNEAMLKEYYYRPCLAYSKGYFYIAIDGVILEEGELPDGIYPIVVKEFDKIQTTPRGRSPIKHMRPYQAEINRSASKMAEHQITLGDDKVLIQNGTKISAGVALPGVRSINYTGIEPKVFAGRDGSQYLNYMVSQIQELYEVMNVKEDSYIQDGKLDVYGMLFTSASKKKQFQKYLKKFEKFLKDVAWTYLRLAKLYFSDNNYIRAVGRNEMVNIQEFRSSDELSFDIVIEAQGEDIELKMGKQLALSQTLQYAGNTLSKEDLGKLMRAMPYVNKEQVFDDLVIDYDSVTNDILALDRGESPPIGAYDNYVYSSKRLTLRMRQSDFKYLSPQIQQAYEQRVQMLNQLEAERVQQLQMAEAGLIPTGGYLVTMDFYESDPKDPAKKTRRVRLPYESVQWLIEKLATQGQSQERLQSMNEGALAQMAGMLGQAQGGATPQSQGGMEALMAGLQNQGVGNVGLNNGEIEGAII